MILLRLIVLVAALVSCPSVATRAQDGTPAAGLVPVPAACDVDRRSLEEIIALFPETAATPEQGGSIGQAEEATPAPSGAPADAETVAAITTLMGQALACSNAGDRLGGLSAFSDGFIQELYHALYGDGGVTRPELEALLAPPATPVSEPRRYVRVAVINAVVLADGRVAGAVVTSAPDDEPLLVYFVEQEGRWLIDEIPEP